MISGIRDLKARNHPKFPVPPAVATPSGQGRPSRFIVGADLGQARDYTALSVLESLAMVTDEQVTEGFALPTTKRTTRLVYHLRHLRRLPLGTTYPDVVDHVVDLMARLPLRATDPALVVDFTGVGRPIVDLMRKAGLRPVAVSITGGAEEHGSHPEFTVPKRILVSNLSVLLQASRLRIAPDIAEAQILVAELSNFKVKISNAGHDSYGAWRDSVHDDLVLSVALGAWLGERGLHRGTTSTRAGWMNR
jgi:hypothetical protein